MFQEYSEAAWVFLMSSVQDFLSEHPDLLARLSPAGRNAFLKIGEAIAHLRSRQSRLFFFETYNHLADTDSHPLRDTFLEGGVLLSSFNWALVPPYFSAVTKISPDVAFIEKWTRFAHDLARRDIDAALTFLERTPQVIKNLGAESIMPWGRQALEALNYTAGIWLAVKAYLQESADPKCFYPLAQWKFFLEQAARIAEISPQAAEAFIKLGNRVCLLLTDQETGDWIAQGLVDCRTEEELINYFSGTSLSALEKRDRLASGVALKDRRHTLSLICEALLGHPVKIRSNISLVGHKGFSGGAASDGRTIFLPDMVPDFGLFKLMALHQSMVLSGVKFLERSGKFIFDPIQIHLDADRRLLNKLPGLIAQMEIHLPDGLPADYPHGLKAIKWAMPWWGDILPDLINETSATIAEIKTRAAEIGELPPEVIDSLLSAMMAEGQRDADELWKLFRDVVDNMEFTSPDPEELQENIKTYLYKEWDNNLSDYKLEWCLVRQRLAKDDPNPFVGQIRERLHGIIKLIRRQFLKLKPERFRKFRAQPSGDGLDIDALVQALVDMRSGAFLTENVYIRRDKRLRDVAVLFLMDLSASTEEKVNSRRFIDIQKEAMVLMAEALDSLQDPYAIFGFSSDGRFRVDMFHIKDFNEDYDERVQNRIGNLEPLGLTRMGAVIRHAAYKLENVSAMVKLLVILTDGRPYDLEYGNLDYAIADTKKAIQEVRRRRIHPFIITSDQKSTDYLKRIAPQTQSIILPKVELLPTLMPALYKRLTL